MSLPKNHKRHVVSRSLVKAQCSPAEVVRVPRLVTSLPLAAHVQALLDVPFAVALQGH